jgi:hypothetical protein
LEVIRVRPGDAGSDGGSEQSGERTADEAIARQVRSGLPVDMDRQQSNEESSALIWRQFAKALFLKWYL